DYAKQVAEQIPLPAYAISGITPDNAEQVWSTGIHGIAVTRAVTASPDVATACRGLLAGASFSRDTELEGQAADPVGQAIKPASGGASHSCPAEPTVGQAFLPVSGGVSAGHSCPAEPTRSNLHTKRRRLPHWQLDGSTYFITFRLHHGELSEPERDVVLRTIHEGQHHHFDLIAAVV